MSAMAIVGSGEYLEPMIPVDRALLELAGPSSTVVCIPAAAGREGAAKIDDWMQRGVDHFAALGCDAQGARVWNRTTADDADLAQRIEQADVVYLSGGSPSYLHATLESTRAWTAIEAVLERGGLLVGCSAGAMVQGEWFAGGVRRSRGFGLWPGVLVIPHFDEIPGAVTSTMRRLVGRGQTVVGVNGNTALLRSNGVDRVIGGGVTVWSTDGRSTHEPGPLPQGLLPS